MRYVLDSNIALKWVLMEVDSPQALQLRDNFQAGVHELLAPDIFHVEVAHALTRSERRNIIQVGQAAAHFGQLLATSPQFHPHIPLLPCALTISSAARAGVYDCLYVALAEREACQLVAADARLLNNLQTQFPFIIALAAVP